MKRVLLKSVFDAFDYVMDHYAPAGLEEMAEKQDSYAVISIQDARPGGFGFSFQKTGFCRDVLTLYFDDIIRETDGAVLFDRDQAARIIRFIDQNREAESLLVHCYGGQSRSRAVAAFAVKMLGGDNAPYFQSGAPNRHVYDLLISVWKEGMTR